MSLIFDALQKSEGERSGADLSVLPAVTELLERVERRTVSEWKSAEREFVYTTEDPSQNTGLPLPVTSSAVAVESPAIDKLSLTEKQLDQFAQFKSLKVSTSPQGQLVCLTDGESLAAEKFRFLGVRLRHMRRERPLKKVLITSTIPREGKSTVAANLACVLARKKQQRILLLEGDVRRPSLCHLFGVERMPGLCDWLQSNEIKITNIYHLEGPDLWILPAGSTSGNPLELLQSAKLSILLDEVAALFDWVIIDSPPILPLADTSVWSRLTDGIILVARQGITEKRQLQRGLEALDNQKLIGALLNGSHTSTSSDHYYYYRPSTGAGAESQAKDGVL